MNKKTLLSTTTWVIVLLFSSTVLAPVSTLAVTSKNNSSSSNNSTANASSSDSSANVNGTVIESYNASSSVLSDMIVGLRKDKSEVVPLTFKDNSDMLGVVVPVGNTTITLTPQSSATQQVLVATSGNYNVLVSNQDGPIKSGDYLTMSSLDGIAMKASQTVQDVVGRATASVGSANAIDTITLKGQAGQPSKVTVYNIPVQLRLAPNPAYTKSSGLPGVVTKTADAVASKPVTLAQIYLCLTILLLTFITTGSVYYSGVRSAIISIGRNPLSKKSIVAGLIKVLAVGLIIFGAGVFASYLILKL